MTRPRSSTIYIKRRAVKVERAPVAKPSKWRTVQKIAAWRAGQTVAEPAIIFEATNEAEKNIEHGPVSIVDEVTRCLAHGPIAFPRKLWGEVL